MAGNTYTITVTQEEKQFLEEVLHEWRNSAAGISTEEITVVTDILTKISSAVPVFTP